MAFSSDLFGPDGEAQPANELLKYLQHQPPEVLSRVAKSVTPEMRQIANHNVQGLLGMLPQEHFDLQVTTNRDNLSGLLVSAMMTGYFLRQMEQRMELETSLMGTSFPSLDNQASSDD
jgi:23S rRNA G2069 N7-methylase RlmK/C1962 C5-methylase RlmI